MMMSPNRLLAAVSVVALSAAPAAANAELTRSGGVLDGPLTYTLEGDPGSIYVFFLSLSQGPTPLAIVDPGDPRSLSVALDLLNLTSVGVFTTGTATVAFPNISNDPGLACLPVYAQFITTPGATTTVDEISNPVSVVFTPPGESCNTLSENVLARQGHTATALADGRVLVAGGDEPGATLTTTDTIELYDPQLMTFSSGSTLIHARSTHTATVLADGRVLLLGGYDETGTVRTTGEIFDPSTGATTPIAPMSYPRTQHTATLMNDGRIFVAGGGSVFDLSNVLGSLASATDETEVYNPATNSWTSGPDLNRPTIGHAASLLGDGRVLLTGGVDVTLIIGIPIPSFPSTCYRYDAGSNSLLNTADLPSDRTYHGQVTLSNGDALAIGGADGNFTTLSFTTLASCLRYSTAGNSWATVGSLNEPRAYPNLVTTGGRTYLLGGLNTIDGATGSGNPATLVESTSNGTSWTSEGNMLLPREVGRAAVVDGGERILTVGTGETAGIDKTAEFFAP